MTLGIVTPMLYAKATGKTVGVPGSIAHTLSNEQLTKQGKAKTIAEQTKEQAKDVLNLCGSVVAVGASTALATGCSNKVQAALHSVKKGVANLFDNIILKGYGELGQNVSLKDAVKELPTFKKFNSLPTAAKAGIIAGIATLSIVAPIYGRIIAGKAGCIEGKNEAK